jgi:branched-chain amino acid transport system substrate-binding protein
VRYRHQVLGLIAGLAAITVTVTACSSSSKSTTSSAPAGGGSSGSSSSSASTGGGTIKLGVITDSTGAAASGFQTTESGIKAYVDYINGQGGVNGQKLSYVMADSTSTPAGALIAAQKLVQTDKVFAVISVSSDFYGAEAYLLKAGVPVIGQGFDGTEWTEKSNTNLFATQGVIDYDKVYTADGNMMKSLGVTSCGAVGYSSSPSAQKSATEVVKSCEAAGLKNGYENQVAFGSTDMAPVALAMKNAGIDGVYLPVVPNTGFALAAALRQQGVKPKAFVLATGYGGDLLRSSAAVEAAQGFQFSSNGEPVEMNTPATQKLAKNLAAVGVTGTPTFAEQTAYIAMAGFVSGLQAAGANPTRDKYMTALRGISSFDADGLLAPLKVSFSDYSPDQICRWIVTLTGKTFVPVKGQPFCGGPVSS